MKIIINGEAVEVGGGGSGGESSSNVYSTEEIRVGIWIDGSNVYQKTYQFTTPSSNVTNSSTTPIISDDTTASMKNILKMEGYVSSVVEGGTRSAIYPIPLAFNSNRIQPYYTNGGIVFYLNGTYLQSCPGVLTVTYTKKNDAEPIEGHRWWSPTMTSATTPSPYSVTASAYNVGSTSGYGYPWQGLAGNNEVAWYKNGSVRSAWLQVYLGEGITVQGFSVESPTTGGNTNYLPSGLTIQGSNDETTWTDLAEMENLSTTEQNVVYLARDVSYKYYRITSIVPRSESSDYMMISNWRFYKKNEEGG